jgi:hypothetical protein
VVGDVSAAIQYEIAIVQGDGRMLSLGEIRHRVLKSSSQIGVRRGGSASTTKCRSSTASDW